LGEQASGQMALDVEKSLTKQRSLPAITPICYPVP
jgi:hypothetical protein